ncbi:MAG: DNA-binding response regulator VicR [Candidatus Saccharibacteria bacterium]|jgi:CheY-like chemotaxis protein|nr:DNA-binding response regulator VicR [Candidatus Saccharibacteria bacterium]
MKKQPSILIIEDDAALNQAYVTILSTAGYRVRTAFNGKEALILTTQEEPDIIFLDLRMPTLDGVGFLKAYKPKTQHKNVEIIVFSNYDLQQEIDEAYEFGAQRYVLKARASPKELIRIVEDSIAIKK